MTPSQVLILNDVLSFIVLLMASIRLGLSIAIIVKGKANTNELAIGMLSSLVVMTVVWIYLDKDNYLIKTGTVTRFLLVLIYLKLLFVQPNPQLKKIFKKEDKSDGSANK